MRFALAVLVLAASLAVTAPAHAQSERFRGLWEGMFHGGRGDQPMALTVRPRCATGFAGTLYQEGMELGSVESARIAGDSLTFSVMGYDIVGIATGERMAVNLTVRNGQTHQFEMTRTSADTTRLPARTGSPRVSSRLVRETAPDSVFRAHAPAKGEAVSIAACVQKGTLLLVGGGATQADLDRRFVELAGGGKARIVTTPTAAIDDTNPASLERWADLPGLGHAPTLHTLSRREADSDAFVAPLRQATGVWIPGGEASWLLDSYLGTRTERALIGVLERGGVVGGTSAGAVVWASTLMSFRQDTASRALQLMRVENLMIGDLHGTGFALLRNVSIAPHMDAFHLEPSLRRMVAEIPGLLGIGIDEATALEVHGDVGRVLGRGNVTIYAGGIDRPPVVLKEGARYDLVHRKVL